MKKFYFLISFIFITSVASSLASNTNLSQGSTENLFDRPTSFIENKGQITDESGEYRDDVHFVAQFPGVNVFFTDEGVVYYFKKTEASKLDMIEAGKLPDPFTDREWDNIRRNGADKELTEIKTEAYRIDLHFLGAKLEKPEGEAVQQSKYQYFSPVVPDGAEANLYGRIRYNNVYPGIDLVFHSSKGYLKYDFEVSPNADPQQIKILYEGHENITIADNGNAIVEILPGTIVEKAPESFQNGKEIESAFTVSNDTLMFKIGSYDKSKALTIDPALEWSTYFHDGSTSAAFTYSNPVWDSNGNMFVVVNTYNNDNFPLINPGGNAYYQTTPGANGLQMVIMKFNSDRQIVWATYYSGSQSARAAFSNNALTINQNDNIYIIGSLSYPYSGTNTFPLYNPGGGAYYESNIGNGRDFILKFSSSGQRLWATCFHSSVNGGSSGLDLNCVYIDQSNRLLIGGQAYTPVNYRDPIPLANPGGSAYYKSSPIEDQVPVIGRFSSSDALQWCTYISEGEAETYNSGYAMTVDNSNNIFFVGTAGQEFNGGSPSIYNTVDPGGGAYQDNNNTGTNNGRKCVIFKFNTSLQITWSTLFGGETRHNYDGSGSSVTWQDFYDVETDGSGNVFIAGRVNTIDFPLYNPGGGAYYQSSLSYGGSYHTDGVIVKFTNGGVLNWSTYYGGDGTSDGTQLYGLGIDGGDNVYLSGITRNNNFPIQSKSGSYNQSSYTGDYAMVVLQFNNSGVRQWASYFGNQTYMSAGGFGVKGAACGGSFTIFSTVNTYSVPTLDPGGGAYYYSLKDSGTTTDFIAEFTDGGSGGGGGTPGIWGWTGAVNSDWFEPCNWDKASVPTSTSPVYIPGGTSNQPEISGAKADCYNIEINSSNGANLNIYTNLNGSLQVHQ
ncbi:MAG: hypothetical protein WD426_13415 [Anditalea sp.]